MEEMILGFAEKYPVILTIAAVMGIARMVLKPLMSFLHEYVLITPSEKDDKLLESVETSSVYKAVVWVLDFVLSLKLPKKK